MIAGVGGGQLTRGTHAYRKQNSKLNTWEARGAHGEHSQLRGSSRGAETTTNLTAAATAGGGGNRGGGGAAARWSSIRRRRGGRGGRGSYWRARVSTGGTGE